MSQPHHHDPAEEGSNPAKLAIGIAIAVVALVVGIILLTQLAVGVYGSRSRKDDPAMSDEAVGKRLAPVAQVVVDQNVAPPAAAPANVASAAQAPAPAAPAAAAPAAAAPAAAAGGKGKSTYDGICMACHAAGVAGAPKLGDKAAWAPRLKTGKDALYNSALKGKGAMPAKGGNAGLPDADVKAAVDYMVSAAQ